MAFLRTLLFVGMLGVTVLLVSNMLSSVPSTKAAASFIGLLQKGDEDSIINTFGENSCHCQPRGGYLAYLKYESGENDNLAFLFGHKFKAGALSEKSVPTIEKLASYHMPMQEPESTEVDIPISFDKE